MDKKSVMKNYAFLAILLGAMVLGCVVGAFAPKFAAAIKPLGTVFINMMFCVVVPLVFASISTSVACTKSRARAGKIMGTTVATFVVTGAIAAVIMFLILKVFPPVLEPWSSIPSEEMGEYASFSDMIVNFFTVSDFSGLLSRRAMLPLIVFSVLFGFSANLAGGPEGPIAQWLSALSDVMMKFVKIITYYAPVAFFAIFADLMATYGPQMAGAYGRALAVYYPLCFVYVFTAFPLFAWIGGGKGAVREMFRHILKPAMVSLGTCSSVATIPTNLDAAADTGISKDVAEMVCPLGATMHMDGSCFSCVLKIAFVFGVFGKDFGIAERSNFTYKCNGFVTTCATESGFTIDGFFFPTMMWQCRVTVKKFFHTTFRTSMNNGCRPTVACLALILPIVRLRCFTPHDVANISGFFIFIEGEVLKKIARHETKQKQNEHHG